MALDPQIGTVPIGVVKGAGSEVYHPHHSGSCTHSYDIWSFPEQSRDWHLPIRVAYVSLEGHMAPFLPFLKAHQVTDEEMELSARSYTDAQSWSYAIACDLHRVGILYV